MKHLRGRMHEHLWLCRPAATATKFLHVAEYPFMMLLYNTANSIEHLRPVNRSLLRGHS
jgi:hypothetical protein